MSVRNITSYYQKKAETGSEQIYEKEILTEKRPRKNYIKKRFVIFNLHLILQI